jgi:uracil phosphoribosyltransferase
MHPETHGAPEVISPVVALPILRAGLGMLPAFLEVLPEAAVGYLGLERNEETAVARRYYEKMPDVGGADVFVLDPMLATGGSAAIAAQALRGRGARSVSLLSIVAAPEGIAVKFAIEAAKHLPAWEIIDTAYAGKMDAPSGMARELAWRLPGNV